MVATSHKQHEVLVRVIVQIALKKGLYFYFRQNRTTGVGN
jgi:hypothetical protein